MKTWSDITLNQLIEFKALNPELDEFDRAVAIVSIAYSMPVEEVESLSLVETLNLFAKCDFLNHLPKEHPTLYANGKDWDNKRRKYKFNYDIRHIKGHHYVELQHILAQGDSIDKLPEIMALITTELVGYPFKLWEKKVPKENVMSEYQDRVRFFRYHANVQDCYPVMLFFSLLWKTSYEIIQSSLTSKIEEANQLVTEATSL